jgi:hypothetical protein
VSSGEAIISRNTPSFHVQSGRTVMLFQQGQAHLDLLMPSRFETSRVSEAGAVIITR